jgi:hypothetical protein
MEKMREEFDAWIGRYGYSHYADSADLAWSAWQASRAALVVELPQPFEGDDFTMYDGAELHEALEAAGVRIKG